MSDLPPEFDLKLMPDWLKEQPAKNPYANFEGERERSPRGGDRGSFRNDGPRPPRRDDRAGGGRPPNRGAAPGGRRDSRSDSRGDSRRSDGPRPDRFRDSRDSRPQQAPVQPAPVKIEFFPENHFVEAVLAYIRSTGHAFALFDLARSFLVKQDRHRVRISVTEPSAVLHQVGERGPVSFDLKLAESAAFKQLRGELYTEEVIEKEPIKGNFSNVARCRLSGEILGPTSHHSYQMALRKHYEQRFSKRMSFQDFLREIETSSKPEDVEAWKESARRSTVYKTVGEEAPVEFADLAQVEAHFRKNHLPKALRSGGSFEMTGVASHNLADRRIAEAVQLAWEIERAFPGQMMFHLREQFVRAGMHFFKHHKRQQFICATRPQPIKEHGLSENIVRIIRALEEKPGCTRVDLAQMLLEPSKESPELPKMKAALASDLHWLRQAGNILEFSDGTLDLPRKKSEEDAAPSRPQGGRGQQKKQPAKAEAAAVAVEAPEAAEAPVATEAPVAIESEVIIEAPAAVEEIVSAEVVEAALPVEPAQE